MTIFYPVPGFDVIAFQKSTLIIPSVSLANLPQLTVDLLISSLELKRVGWIGRGETVTPFAGLGDDGSIVSGGLEVYGKEASGLFVIQQRSPTIKSKKDAHVELLRSFIVESNFSFTLILTSLDAANQDDAQLITPHQHIVPPTDVSSEIATRISSNLPPLSLRLSESSLPHLQTQSTIYPPFLPGAGLTRRLLSALPPSVPHGCIAAWCVEGDNRGDAYAFVDVILKVLRRDGVQIKEPKSWEGLFGTTHGWSGGSGMDAEIYG